MLWTVLRFHGFRVRSATGAVVIALGLAAASLPRTAVAVDYERSALNLPASCTAFETGYDLDGDGLRDVFAVFQRRILVFLQSRTGTIPSAPDLEIGSGQPIPETYAAVSVGKVTTQTGSQILFFGPKGVDSLAVSELRGSSETPVEPQPLIRRTLEMTAEPTLQYLGAAIDMDGDAKADVLLPVSDGMDVFRPDSAGNYKSAGRIKLPMQSLQWTSFRSEPALLGSFFFDDGGPQGMVQPPPRLDRWLGVQFIQEASSGPFLAADYDQDKRLDILTRSRIFHQTDRGEFTSAESGVFGQIASSLAVQKRRLVAAPNLVDFNGDGILDTFQVSSSATKTSPRTDISVFLGKADRTFPAEPNFVLRTRDLAFSEVIPIGDVNGDGAQDVALINLDFQASSPSSQLKAYVKNGLDGRLCFYLWDKRRNRFPETYAFTHPILLNYQIYGTKQLLQQQIFINHDMDGDGLPDLVMKTGPMEISVFRNEGGKGFSTKPIARINTAPTRFSSFRVEDLNGDKRGDVIVSGYADGQEDRTIYSFFISK